MNFNQMDVKYVNMCIFDCFNTVLTCMIEFSVFGVDIGALIGLQ